MTLTDPNARRSTVARLVAEPEAVAAAPFAFAPREPDPAALAHGGLGLGMGGECPTKVDRGLLEHLRGDRLPPPQPVTCLMMVPSGATTNSRPASSVFFQALNALIRSNP